MKSSITTRSALRLSPVALCRVPDPAVITTRLMPSSAVWKFWTHRNDRPPSRLRGGDRFRLPPHRLNRTKSGRGEPVAGERSEEER